MVKIDVLRRLVFHCFTATSPPAAATDAVTTKKRLSTSLRDDLEEPKPRDQEDRDSNTTDDASIAASTIEAAAPPRASKTMVIGTIFGQRRGHAWFCVQSDRLSPKPFLLLELSVPTRLLVQEMRCGLLRIALECNEPADSEISRCPLRSVPVWTLFCNGRKLGFAARRRATGENRLMLKKLQSTTVGAGVIPSGFGSGPAGHEVMYMRANYECVVGSSDSESFHLINPDGCPGQELSVFLLRSMSR